MLSILDPGTFHHGNIPFVLAGSVVATWTADVSLSVTSMLDFIILVDIAT